MIALDTEDDSKGSVYIINFYDGLQHISFVGDGCRLAAWNWLLTQGKETVWACNAEYDLVNLFGPWLGKMCTLQYVRSGLLRASFRDSPVLFLDTLRHWPMSVEAMGEYLGLSKLSRDYRSVEYCRRDTEIVWRFVSEMLARYDGLGLAYKATLPSMAFQLWRRMSTVDPVVDAAVIPMFREGYYGGRVEVFHYGELRGPIYHYDVNSLFPYVMASKEYPMLSWSEVKSPHWDSHGMATVTLMMPEMKYPTLPVRTSTGLLFPYGVLTGTWTYPEIRQALNDGARILNVHRAIEMKASCDPFTDFVGFCWGHRLASTSELDRVFWKLMMNSLYGKFGQTDGLEMIFQDRSIMLPTRSPHANVIWSAYVTAYARLELLRWLRVAYDVYYTDTDSIFTNTPLPTARTLGALKQEGQYSRAEFVGKKIYTVDDSCKAKGVPNVAASDFIRTGKAMFMKPARFRESRRSFQRANVWYEYEKYLREEIPKRRILSDGRTEPWRLDEYTHRFPDEVVGVPAMRRR